MPQGMTETGARTRPALRKRLRCGLGDGDHGRRLVRDREFAPGLLRRHPVVGALLGQDERGARGSRDVRRDDVRLKGAAVHDRGPHPPRPGQPAEEPRPRSGVSPARRSADAPLPRGVPGRSPETPGAAAGPPPKRDVRIRSIRGRGRASMFDVPLKRRSPGEMDDPGNGVASLRGPRRSSIGCRACGSKPWQRAEALPAGDRASARSGPIPGRRRCATIRGHGDPRIGHTSRSRGARRQATAGRRGVPRAVAGRIPPDRL